jgi:hypothetical protein
MALITPSLLQHFSTTTTTNHPACCLVWLQQIQYCCASANGSQDCEGNPQAGKHAMTARNYSCIRT